MKDIYEMNETMQMLGAQEVARILGDKEQFKALSNVINAHVMNTGASTNDVFGIAFDAFSLGLIYGKKAERARRKTKKPQEE